MARTGFVTEVFSEIASNFGSISGTEAIIFDKEFNVFDDVSRKIAADDNIKCILLDEAQFLTKGQVEQLTQIVDELNVPVLAYGLRTDFQTEPFPGSMYLLAWADIIIELKTICHCGRKATMNMRIDESGNALREGEQVQIGGNESYISTCRHHFRLGQGVKLKHKEQA